MTNPSLFSFRTLSLAKSFNDDTSNALLLLRTIRFRSAFLSPCAGRLPESPVLAFLLFFVFSDLTPFLGAATMPFRFGAVAWRAADVEKNAARGNSSRDAVDGRAAASIESWEKLRRHMEGGMVTMEACSLYNGEVGCSALMGPAMPPKRRRRSATLLPRTLGALGK
jgi:hypothetical protein